MSSQPVEANVVLTADNSGYDQAMNQSSTVTQNLGQNVDTLGSKISKLTKTAGKSLIGISAADIALIGGATAAWSSYEKQMTRLQAQSAVLTRSTTEQNKLMKDYTGSVKALRTEFGITTTEAANLVQTLSKVTNLRQSAGLEDLSKVFVKMSNATGESSEGLASSLTNLQKMMGSPINAQSTKKYADQYTYLAAQTNTSAQGLIDFASQLAPTGKAIGMHADSIAGWATAFTRAGQDGGPAAQIFTKITNDISHSLATGSPEIAHYANMLGVTQKQFKQLGGDEQVLRLFEKLHAEGKGAATEFGRLNLDSVRGIRAVRGVLASGDLRQTVLGLPNAPEVKGSVDRGSKEVMDNLGKQMDKLKDQSQQLAETFGEMFGPAIAKFVDGMTKALEIVNKIASGPLGQMIGWVMKIVAPFAAGAGAILLFAGALFKLAGVFALLRNSMAGGVREGFKGGSAISGEMGEGNTYLARGDREMGKFGEKLAGVTSDRPGTWLQRAQYNAGIYGGRGIRAVPNAAVSAAQWAWEKNPLTDYTRTPGGTGRGLGSYVAGGLARTIDAAVIPQFDQMRYDDPTKRTAGMMAGQIAPWSKMKDRMSYVNALADEHLAGRQIGAIGMERSKVAQDPLLTNQAREARMAELKTIEEETKVRESAAVEGKAAALKQIESSRELAKETGGAAVGARSLKESLIGTGLIGGGRGGGLAGAAGGGVFGAAKLSGKAFMASGMAYPAAGMAGMAVLSATGQDSKALQMGAMGMMMGPWGAGIGAVTGAILDMTSSNKGLEESLAELKSQTDALAKSGTGLASWFDDVTAKQQELDKTTESRSASNMWKSPTNLFGAIWNWGNRNVDGGPQAQDQAAIDAERKKGSNIEAANRELARKSGISLQGTPGQQRKQLDDWMAVGGAQRFQTAGIDPEQFYAARAAAQTKVQQSDINVTGGYGAQHQPLDPRQDAAKINAANAKAWKDMLDKLQASKLGPDVESFLTKTVGGKAMEDSPAAQRSIKHQEDVLAEYKATQQMFDDLHKQGLSNIQIMHATAQDMSGIKDSNNQQFKLFYDVFSKSQQTEQMNMPLMTRAQQFQSTMGQMRALETVKPTTPEEKGLIEQKKMETAQGVTDQVQYVKQMLLMQDQYEVNRRRAQDEYHLQQSYQLQDYNLQRDRAEAQFNLSRSREIADYHRQLRRSNEQWNLQRKRQEQDFNHQQELAAKQMAQSAMDIYDRTQVQRTASADWVLSNAQDQLNDMQNQIKNLDTLRQRGMTDTAIQQLHLTDPAQAQEVARLTTEVTTKAQVAAFNKMGRERVKVFGQLAQDPSSLSNEETMRGYRRMRQQALHDHNQSMTWSRQDFMRQLKQQKDDFQLLMHNQSVDFQTMTDRQEKAYRLSMKNSAEDLANAGKEITGSIESILKQGATGLTGYAKSTAQAALDTFVGLKKSTRPVAIAIMKDLADIFGFDYKPPKSSSNNAEYKVIVPSSRGTNDMSQHGTGGHLTSDTGRHEGGVVPGWSPGRDDHMVPLSGGESIMRPEWTRAVGGAKTVDAMNHAAKHGGYAAGGVFRPINRPVTNGPHDQTTGYTAIDFATGVGTPVYAVTGGRISRSYDITGIEPRRAMYGKSQDGFRSYGKVMYLKTDVGPEVLYAHLSKRGFAEGVKVHGGEAIGLSGDTGNSTGPHLHFGDSDGNPYEFLLNAGKGAGTISGGIQGAAAAMTARQVFKQVFQDRYHQAEKAARQMQGVHPLFPGDISQVINRFGRHAVHLLRRKYGAPSRAGDVGVAAPAGVHGDVAIGKAMAAQMGWTGNEWNSLYQLWQHESGWNHLAENSSSGAYGIPQSLPGSKMATAGADWRTNPATQIQWGLNYIKNRSDYGSPSRAWSLWQSRSPHWYGNGAVFNGAQTIGVGEKGPEAVIPLNDRGGEFLTKAMMGVDARRLGLHSSPAGAINVFNTRIDKSTNFTGAIHVTAQDPAELLAKLQARQRLMALTRPSLTGSAA